RFGDQERARDLVGRQTAEQSQGERDARLWREGRVTTGEDEAQPIVMHGSRLHVGFGVVVRGRDRRYLPEQLSFARLTPQTIDGPLAGGGRDPATGIGRQAIRRPPAQRDGERLLDRVFGNVDVAENADQGGDRPARVLAKDLADGRLVDA